MTQNYVHIFYVTLLDLPPLFKTFDYILCEPMTVSSRQEGDVILRRLNGDCWRRGAGTGLSGAAVPQHTRYQETSPTKPNQTWELVKPNPTKGWTTSATGTVLPHNTAFSTNSKTLSKLSCHFRRLALKYSAQVAQERKSTEAIVSASNV